MTTKRALAAVMMGAMLASPAAAQEESAPAPDTETAQAAEEGASAPEAPAPAEAADDTAAQDSTAAEAPAEETAPAETAPTEGETYIAEEFGDWQFSCIRSGTGNDPCRFTQTLENGEGGRVAQVSVIPLPPGEPIAAAAIIETPLGTLLRVPRSAEQLSQPGGLRMRVDQGELRVFQFSFCNAGGCVAEIGMEQELVDAFKRGAVATITIWSADAPGQPVELPLSLTGFTAGFERVSALAQQAGGVAE